MSPTSINAPLKKRFISALAIYYGNSRGVARQPTTPTAGVGNSAKAAKTMNTRQTLLGDKKTTGAGVQSIRAAGKARTQSSK